MLRSQLAKLVEICCVDSVCHFVVSFHRISCVVFWSLEPLLIYYHTLWESVRIMAGFFPAIIFPRLDMGISISTPVVYDNLMRMHTAME